MQTLVKIRCGLLFTGHTEMYILVDCFFRTHCNFILSLTVSLTDFCMYNYTEHLAMIRLNYPVSEDWRMDIHATDVV